jgi:type II secretory pathway pseudopilin PulG
MSKFQFQNNKSFTLVELLIVIGILAILTAAVIVVLNPAELLQQSRDSKRLQDLSSLESTINLAESLHPDIDLGTASTVYISVPSDESDCSDLGLPTLPTTYNYACVSEDNLYNTDGTGWIPINFQDTELAGVITLSSLPTDPTNTTSTGLYYTYIPGGSYELTAILESDKYRSITADDGGDSFSVYEKGTDLVLSPYSDSGLVGYRPFEEGSGTSVLDGSGNNYTGTTLNSPTWVEGKKGYGIRVTTAAAQSASVDWADFLIEDSTVMFWMKAESITAGYKDLVNTQLPDPNRFHIKDGYMV